MIDATTTTRMRRVFGWGRMAVGALLSLAPRLAGTLWYGHEPSRAAQMALRGWAHAIWPSAWAPPWRPVTPPARSPCSVSG